MKYPGVARYSQYGFGFWKDDWMKKEKLVKTLCDIVHISSLVMPFAWVFTCIDLGIRWIYEKPIEGIVTLIASTLISFLLYALGYCAAETGFPGGEFDENTSLKDRVKSLAILLVGLFFITAFIVHNL